MTSSATTPVRARRTQRERREATIAKLIDATMAALTEVGYAGTSVNEICGRAGVSHGALFRHFATRADLLAATAEEVGRRQLEVFTERFSGSQITADTLRTAAELVREAARSELNTVWYELMHAARADADLRARLEPALREYHRAISERGRLLLAPAGLPDEVAEAMIFVFVRFVDGESMTRHVDPDADLDQRCLDLLVTMARDTLAGARTPSACPG